MIKEYKNTGYFCTPYGDIYRKKASGWVRIAPQENSKYGYKQVEIYDGKGNKERVYLHVFIYTAWLGEVKDGFEIDHIDFNPRNNNVKNLRQISISQNRSKKKLQAKRGINSGVEVLTIEQVSWLKSIGKFNKSKMAKELGVSRGTIYYALKEATNGNTI